MIAIMLICFKRWFVSLHYKCCIYFSLFCLYQITFCLHCYFYNCLGYNHQSRRLKGFSSAKSNKILALQLILLCIAAISRGSLQIFLGIRFQDYKNLFFFEWSVQTSPVEYPSIPLRQLRKLVQFILAYDKPLNQNQRGLLRPEVDFNLIVCLVVDFLC